MYAFLLGDNMRLCVTIYWESGDWTFCFYSGTVCGGGGQRRTYERMAGLLIKEALSLLPPPLVRDLATHSDMT